MFDRCLNTDNWEYQHTPCQRLAYHHVALGEAATLLVAGHLTSKSYCMANRVPCGCVSSGVQPKLGGVCLALHCRTSKKMATLAVQQKAAVPVKQDQPQSWRAAIVKDALQGLQSWRARGDTEKSSSESEASTIPPLTEPLPWSETARERQ